MPIRPIDMISIAPRSQEAANQHLNSQNKAEHAQSNMVQQFGKHVKENSEVVIQTSKGEQKEYRYDAKEKGNGSYSGHQNNKGKKSKDEGKKKPEEIKQGSFDIKI